jgi:DNA-binding transcriptional ArsR family regulator
MALVISLDVAELAATRFATSPLAETIRALQLLAKPDPPAVNLPWLRWTRARLDRRPLRVPRLWPLVVTGRGTYPEFLIPAPAGQRPAFADELTRMAATPAPAARASLRRVFADGPWPPSAIELFERPEFGRIAAELADCHDRLIAPHWERIRAVLEADIAYRTGLLAAGGARQLFSDMHPDLNWQAGTLTLADADTGRTELRVRKGPDGLVLMPTVFGWPDVSLSRATSTQTVMMYPARGAATAWHALADRLAGGGTAAEHLLGASRARLLSALRAPATTTVLACQLGVTPSAVSQHLRFLYRGGLLTRQRSGRAVLYQTSELGLALLAARAGAFKMTAELPRR